MIKPTKKLIRSVLYGLNTNNFAISKAIRPRPGCVRYDIYTYKVGTFQHIEQALRLSPFTWKITTKHYPTVTVSNYDVRYTLGD